MIYRNADGTNVIQFGTGDIEVGNGRTLSNDGKEMFPCCIFVPLKTDNEIGAFITPDRVNDPAESNPTHILLLFLRT